MGALALLLILPIAVIGSATYYELTRTKADDVEAMIEERLPRGASTEQVFRFLDSRGFEYGAVEAISPEDGELLELGVPADAMTISAILRNNGYSLTHTDIAITFIIDERSLLKDYIVREVGR